MTSNHTVRKARVAAERALRAAEAHDDVRPDDAPTTTGTRRFYADGLTEYGRKGQCGGCGTWRPDGQPPTVHRYRCPYGPDGEEFGPIYDPAPLEAIKRSSVKKPLTAGHSARPRR